LFSGGVFGLFFFLMGQGGLRMLPKSIAGIGVQLVVGHQAVANGSQHIEVLAVAVAVASGIGIVVAIAIAAAVAVAVAIAVAAAAALVAVAAARRPIIVRTDQIRVYLVGYIENVRGFWGVVAREVGRKRVQKLFRVFRNSRGKRGDRLDSGIRSSEYPCR